MKTTNIVGIFATLCCLNAALGKAADDQQPHVNGQALDDYYYGYGYGYEGYEGYQGYEGYEGYEGYQGYEGYEGYGYQGLDQEYQEYPGYTWNPDNPDNNPWRLDQEQTEEQRAKEQRDEEEYGEGYNDLSPEEKEVLQLSRQFAKLGSERLFKIDRNQLEQLAQKHSDEQFNQLTKQYELQWFHLTHDSSGRVIPEKKATEKKATEKKAMEEIKRELYKRQLKQLELAFNFTKDFIENSLKLTTNNAELEKLASAIVAMGKSHEQLTDLFSAASQVSKEKTKAKEAKAKEKAKQAKNDEIEYVKREQAKAKARAKQGLKDEDEDEVMIATIATTINHGDLDVFRPSTSEGDLPDGTIDPEGEKQKHYDQQREVLSEINEGLDQLAHGLAGGIFSLEQLENHKMFLHKAFKLMIEQDHQLQKRYETYRIHRINECIPQLRKDIFKTSFILSCKAVREQFREGQKEKTILDQLMNDPDSVIDYLEQHVPFNAEKFDHRLMRTLDKGRYNYKPTRSYRDLPRKVYKPQPPSKTGKWLQSCCGAPVLTGEDSRKLVMQSRSDSNESRAANQLSRTAAATIVGSTFLCLCILMALFWSFLYQRKVSQYQDRGSK